MFPLQNIECITIFSRTEPFHCKSNQPQPKLLVYEAESIYWQASWRYNSHALYDRFPAPPNMVTQMDDVVCHSQTTPSYFGGGVQISLDN